MAEKLLVETVTIGAYKYPAVAVVGSSGSAVASPSPAAAALTDASIASASGASQTIAAANTARQVLNVSNNGTTSWWINETGGTAAAGGNGCFELPPGARWTPRPAPTNAVTGIGTAGQKLTVAVG